MTFPFPVFAPRVVSGPTGTIEFVGAATAAKAGATTGTSTINLNSGLTGGSRSSVQEGDFVLAVFGACSEIVGNLSLSITDGSTDYTLINNELHANGVNDANLRVAYKFMSSSPDTTTTFGPTGDDRAAGAMAVYVFSGVDPWNPFDVAAVPATGINTGDTNPASIVPVTAGSFIVVVGASGHDAGATTFASPSDLISFVTIGSDDSEDCTIGVGHKSDWTSGSFNPEVWTGASASSAATWAAMTIALRPD